MGRVGSLNDAGKVFPFERREALHVHRILGMDGLE